MRMQFYGIVERANAIIDHFRPVARPAVLAQPRLGPPLLAKAVFAMGHDTNECNPRKQHKMLAFVDPASYETVGIRVDGDESPDVPTTLSIGQSAVLLGKMQLQVDRLMENPGGAWDTVLDLGEIACALCTAASKHPTALALAREMLVQLLGASRMSEDQKEHAARGFQHAKRARDMLDPLTMISAHARGLSGKREQELMVITDAIVANTDAALEANVRKAAEHLLKVRKNRHLRTDTHMHRHMHTRSTRL